MVNDLRAVLLDGVNKMNASVNYHLRKPFTQAFEFDVNGIDGNLISPELVFTNINVYDIRNSESNEV